MKMLLTLLVLFSATPASAVEGDKVLNGGDAVGLEFHEAARSAFGKAAEKDPALAAELDRVGLPKLLEEAKVLVLDTPIAVVIPGARQDSVAANDPATKQIYLQRQRWEQLDDPSLREALALHELAGLAGLETTGSYPLSGRYLVAVGRAAGDLLGEVSRVAEARSKYARSAVLTTVRCTRHDKVFADGEERYLLGSEEGGQFTWEQEGKWLRIGFMDWEIDGLRDSLMITRTVKETLRKNERGQELSARDDIKQLSFNEKKVEEVSGVYERTIDWSSPTEGTATNMINGQADARIVKIYESELAPGSNLFVNEYEPNTSAGEGKHLVRYISALSSCTYDRTPIEKIADVLEPKMIAIVDQMDRRVQLFDRALEALSLCRRGAADCAAQEAMAQSARVARDELWQRLVQVKDFDMRVPKVRRVVRRPSPPVQKARRAAQERAWTGVDPESSRRLRELLDRGREERERENERFIRRSQRQAYGDWTRDSHHRPVFSTPWGPKNYRGLPFSNQELRDLVLGDKHYPNDKPRGR